MAHPLLAEIPTDEHPEMIQRVGGSGLSGILGVEIEEMRHGHLEARMDLRDELMLFAGGLIHAGTTVSFADTCAGWGCLGSLPDHVKGFTTIELKVNLLATAKSDDGLVCQATMIHEGRTTQVWDAVVSRTSDGRELAIYRCTQALLEEDRG